MGIPLPQSFPPFAIGKTYSWQFFLLCNQSDRFAVNGVVRRVAITHDMKKELQGRKTLQQKIITYRKYGLCHEMLNLLTKMRYHQPRNPQLSSQWHK